MRVVTRGLQLALHLALAAAALGVLRAVGEPLRRWWFVRACRILGLRVRRIGRPTPHPALFVANHLSWLEVLALGSAAPLSFVAKSEVSRWPLIGSLAASAGTLFLRRGSARAAARSVEQAVLRIAGGESVCVFPEGTSTAGESVLPFKASLFEAAALLGCEVQPVCVYYPREAGAAAVAPFIGDDEFLPHLLRVLAEEEIVVELRFAPPFDGHGSHRSELSAAAWASVDEALSRRRRERESYPEEPAEVVPALWWDASSYRAFARAEFGRARALEPV